MAIYQSKQSAIEAAEKIKLFAQPQRLMILSFLFEGENTVAEIDRATGIGQPALSQQLAELRQAGLISNRREAKNVYYKLASPSVDVCISNIQNLFLTPGTPITVQTIKTSPKEKSEQSSDRLTVGAASFARIL
jgi:DNA-binding transcriptional ArsR family regulator